MIIIYHHNKCVSRIVSTTDSRIANQQKDSITQTVLQLAKQHPLEKIVWCEEKFASLLNIQKIGVLCKHQRMLLSYTVSGTLYLQKKIGYIEQSPFINRNKKVRYPTWLMSSDVGVVDAAVLNIFAKNIAAYTDFEYFLNSIAKLGMPKGLFCYSEPQLLVSTDTRNLKGCSNPYTLFRFVKQHFKKRWLLLLLVNIFIYERKLLLLPFLSALFFTTRRNTIFDFDSIPVQANGVEAKQCTIDVIIPTMGRKTHLYNLLKDLSRQSYLPATVIIVEQNPQAGSASELDYLTTEEWPFLIKHTFTHQTGACNARNIAINQVASDWVFLADDDIVLEANFCSKAMKLAQQYSTTVFTASCLLVGQKQEYTTIHQSGIFGSGTSFVQSSVLKNLSFDAALEHGYGEDTDFGLQLRNLGQDVIYFPSLKITHLKAPIGGFRTPFIHPWETAIVQPKPSPTIMHVLLKYFTNEQLKGYKTVLFLKMIIKEPILKYSTFVKQFQMKWNASIDWANNLIV